jgi:hypothetical protein
MLRRSLRARVRVGAAARRRIQDGGPRATGRPAASLVALCPPCHAQTDAPYARGRLVITPIGNGHFSVEVIRGADKWAIQA